jgi:hypothetical protein
MNLAIFSIPSLEIDAPNTIPPFHTTKAPNAARTSEYGMNAGKIWGTIFGKFVIERSASAARSLTPVS